jgi:hypothetical protein
MVPSVSPLAGRGDEVGDVVPLSFVGKGIVCPSGGLGVSVSPGPGIAGGEVEVGSDRVAGLGGGVDGGVDGGLLPEPGPGPPVVVPCPPLVVLPLPLPLPFPFPFPPPPTGELVGLGGLFPPKSGVTIGFRTSPTAAGRLIRPGERFLRIRRAASRLNGGCLNVTRGTCIRMAS